MADVNNNGIPDLLESAATRPTQVAAPSQTGGVTYNGMSSQQWTGGAGQGFGSGMVALPGYDANGNQLRVDPDTAKAWWEAQATQNSDVWQQQAKAFKQLGVKTTSQMLTALRNGIDYTQNPYANTDDPWTWINAQEIKGSGSGSGGPYTQVQTSTRLSSPSAARTAANQAFESEIGRMATKEESAQFQQALNIAEQNAPTTSVTHGVTSGRNTTASTQTTGGFDAAAFGRDWARSQSDFAESYAAGNFMSLLDKVVSQPNAIEQIMKGLG